MSISAGEAMRQCGDLMRQSKYRAPHPTMVAIRMRFSLPILVVAATVTLAQESPLPTPAQLGDRMLARAKEVDTSGLWSEYEHRRTSVRREFDSDGTLQKQEESRYQMIPKDGLLFPRLLSKDGHQPTASDLKREADRFERSRRRLEERRRTGQSTSDDRMLSPDVLTRFDVTIEGRELQHGRSILRVALKPKPNPPKARTQTDKVLNRLSGRVWIDEQLCDLVRADVRLTEPVSFYAVIGVARQLRIVYEAQLVEDRVWLPARFDMEMDARRLFSQIRTRQTEEFSDYARPAPSP